MGRNKNEDDSLLIYSRDLDWVFSFCCKLFNVISCISKLGNEGSRDWKNVLNLEKYLKQDNFLDLDDLDLFSELNILKEIIGLENDKLIYILNYLKLINYFLNAYITYRIMLIILVSIALAERSFLNT